MGEQVKTERYEIAYCGKGAIPKNQLWFTYSAIAHMNRHGTARSSFEEVIEWARWKLWNYIAV